MGAVRFVVVRDGRRVWRGFAPAEPEQPIRAQDLSMCVCAASELSPFPRAAEGSMATAPCLILPLVVERKWPYFLRGDYCGSCADTAFTGIWVTPDLRRASKMPAEALPWQLRRNPCFGSAGCAARGCGYAAAAGASARAQICQSAADMDAPSEPLSKPRRSAISICRRAAIPTACNRTPSPPSPPILAESKPQSKRTRPRSPAHKATVRPPFLLIADGAEPMARAEFLCGVFGKSGQTKDSAVFVLTNLPPGKYGVAILDVNGGKTADDADAGPAADRHRLEAGWLFRQHPRKRQDTMPRGSSIAPATLKPSRRITMPGCITAKPSLSPLPWTS